MNDFIGNTIQKEYYLNVKNNYIQHIIFIALGRW